MTRSSCNGPSASIAVNALYRIESKSITHQDGKVGLLRYPLMKGIQARRVGQTKSDAKRQHINGREDGQKGTEPAAADPV